MPSNKTNSAANPGRVCITLSFRLGVLSPDIPQIEPPFLDIAPAGMLPTIISHSKGVKCVLIRSNSSFHGPTTVLPSVKSPNRLSTTKSLPWEALLPCTTR